jgi:hypothetical protein
MNVHQLTEQYTLLKSCLLSCIRCLPDASICRSFVEQVIVDQGTPACVKSVTVACYCSGTLLHIACCCFYTASACLNAQPASK